MNQMEHSQSPWTDHMSSCCKFIKICSDPFETMRVEDVSFSQSLEIYGYMVFSCEYGLAEVSYPTEGLQKTKNKFVSLDLSSYKVISLTLTKSSLLC